MEISTERSITPLFLVSNGFMPYTPGEEEVFGNAFPETFDIEFDPETERCFLERKFNRNQFCVVLSKETSGGNHDFIIFIQHNVGCGFTEIPNNFAAMSEYHFALLFEAIRQEKL